MKFIYLFFAVIIILLFLGCIAQIAARAESTSPPSACKPIVAQSFPPNPWEFPSGRYAVCYVLAYDSYGEWEFMHDGCLFGPDGYRCVDGMFATHHQVTIEGPKQFKNVFVWGQYRSSIPIVIR